MIYVLVLPIIMEGSVTLSDTEYSWVNNLCVEDNTWVKPDVVDNTRINQCVMCELWFTI